MHIRSKRNHEPSCRRQGFSHIHFLRHFQRRKVRQKKCDDSRMALREGGKSLHQFQPNFAGILNEKNWCNSLKYAPRKSRRFFSFLFPVFGEFFLNHLVDVGFVGSRFCVSLAHLHESARFQSSVFCAVV